MKLTSRQVTLIIYVAGLLVGTCISATLRQGIIP